MMSERAGDVVNEDAVSFGAAAITGAGDGEGDDAEVTSDTTEDTLLHGRVHLVQPRRGFRSSLDPLLLAAFVTPPFGRFVDIGCGTGAISFLLAEKDARATGVGVEIQPRLAALARLGRARNGLEERLEVVTGDARAPLPRGSSSLQPGAFDLVATNPPFRPAEGGVVSPDLERARATHELTLALDEWLDCAARWLRPGGRLVVVYPASRLVSLLSGCVSRRLAVARLRMVHARMDSPASRVLLEARLKGRRALAVEPPLVLHEADGSFRAEVRQMLGYPEA